VRQSAEGLVVAALCDEDTTLHKKHPEVRRVIRIRLEVRGEAPVIHFQPVSVNARGARLEEGWTEPAEPDLLADA